MRYTFLCERRYIHLLLPLYVLVLAGTGASVPIFLHPVACHPDIHSLCSVILTLACTGDLLLPPLMTAQLCLAFHIRPSLGLFLSMGNFLSHISGPRSLIPPPPPPPLQISTPQPSTHQQVPPLGYGDGIGESHANVIQSEIVEVIDSETQVVYTTGAKSSRGSVKWDSVRMIHCAVVFKGISALCSWPVTHPKFPENKGVFRDMSIRTLVLKDEVIMLGPWPTGCSEEVTDGQLGAQPGGGADLKGRQTDRQSGGRAGSVAGRSTRRRVKQVDT